MSINQINSIEREVQTSLEYISKEDSKKYRQELENLKEEKKLLEGKIRGYITLSDVCHEYKAELKKLQQEYNQLKQKINMKVTEKNDNTSSFSEPPTPGNDPGHGKRTDLDQRKLATTIGTTTSLPKTEIKATAKQFNGTRSTLENIPLSALPRSETPQNNNERYSGIQSTPTRHTLYKESIPMQESMVDVAEEHKLSLSDMGFERVPLASSAVARAGTSQQGDLIVFGSLVSNTPKKETMVVEPAIESLNIAPATEDSEDYNKKLIEVMNQVVRDRTKPLHEENRKLRDTIEVLTHENRDLHERLNNSKTETRQLAMKTEELQAKLHDRSKEGSPQGWVHVNKVSEKSPINPLKLDAKVQGTAEEVNFNSILQQNEQLKDANQKWVSEWDKLQEHFETRTIDLRSEIDRLNKALTEAKIKEQNKEADFEQLLMGAKQKAAEQEVAKSDLTSQLASASQREDTLQARIHQLEELVTSLRRDKQSTEAELVVVKQRLTTSPLLRTSLPEGQLGRPQHQQELQTEVEVLRQQLLVFQEDFDRERQDRATAQSIKDDLKKKCDQYRKQMRLTEVKLAGADTQMKNAEDISRRTLNENEKLQQEILELKRQLRQAQEIREWPGFINSGTRMSPPTQSPPFQYQQPAYRYRPQPQQYIVPPQPQPQYAAPSPLMYLNMPGTQPPQMVRQGYYIGNQGNAGSQHENLPGAWPCNSCTYVNYPGRTVCEMCGYVQTMRQSSSQGNFNPLSETLRPRGDENQPAGLQHTGTTRQNIS